MCLAKNKHLLSRLEGSTEPCGGDMGEGVMSLQAFFNRHGHRHGPRLESL